MIVDQTHVVSADRGFLAIPGRFGWTALEVTLAYRQADPYAVRLVLHTQRGSSPWDLSREHLRAGLRSITDMGEGNVQVAAQGKWLRVHFYPDAPSKRAYLFVSRHVVELFLRETEVVVPYGQESGHIDWTGAKSILEGGGAPGAFA